MAVTLRHAVADLRIMLASHKMRLPESASAAAPLNPRQMTGVPLKRSALLTYLPIAHVSMSRPG
jgi:hypothetical protein